MKTLLTIIILVFVFNINASFGNAQTTFTDYITSLENLKDKKFRKIIITEIREYMRRFPEAKNLNEMQFKIATIYHDSKDEAKSFFAHLEILYLYPESNAIAVSQDRIRSILIQKKKFKKMAAKIEPIIVPAASDMQKEEAYFFFLKTMTDLQFKKIRNPLQRGYLNYLARYPDSGNASTIIFWLGELLIDDRDAYEGLAQFQKIAYLYPSSIHVTASKLKTAEIFHKKLDQPQKAILAYEEFLLEYPDDPQAGYAQFQIAKINEKEKKKYLEAIEAYSAVAQRHPQSVEAVPALFEAARLYEDKFKEYDQAIRIYTEIVRDFPEDVKAPHAYAEAARIYEKRLKDYFNAANVYFKIYGHYPNSTIAVESLYAAAELNEDKLQDYDKALMYYRFVVDKYPNHKLTKKASKRIEKISKRMASD